MNTFRQRLLETADPEAHHGINSDTDVVNPYDAFDAASGGLRAVAPDGSALASEATLQAVLDQLTPLVQFIGEYKFQIMGAAGGTVITAADILAQAIAAGVQVYAPINTVQTVPASAFIAGLSIGLKPVGGGAGGLGETLGQSTTSEAVVYSAGEATNMDPLGVQSFGPHLNGGFYVPTSFERLEVLEGSVASVSTLFATVPA